MGRDTSTRSTLVLEEEEGEEGTSNGDRPEEEGGLPPPPRPNKEGGGDFRLIDGLNIDLGGGDDPYPELLIRR